MSVIINTATHATFYNSNPNLSYYTHNVNMFSRDLFRLANIRENKEMESKQEAQITHV
jgi:hypothetical protein